MSSHFLLPEIVPLPKQLRLSGNLKSTERRNCEGIEHKKAYPEFVTLIIQDDSDGVTRTSTAHAGTVQVSGATRHWKAMVSTRASIAT